MNDMIQIETPGTALAIIPVASLPVILAADENDIFGKLFAELKDFKGDASTERGRKEIISKASKVSTAKQDLLRLGKSLKEDHLRIQKSIVAEEKVIEDRFDALRDQIRAPVTAYENREKDRVADHRARIALIENWAIYPGEWTSEQIADHIAMISTHELLTRDWQEFKAKAEDTIAGTLNALKRRYQEAAKQESDAVELARLQAKEAERLRLAAIEAQRIREEQIAAEAAETARKAAEAEAARQAQEAEARTQAAMRAQEEAARLEREDARRREIEAAEALARAESERLAGIERERVAAVKAEAERIASHERALASIGGMIRDACSPMNGSDMIRHITKVMDGMAEMTRDWEEFGDRATAVIAEGREQIAERLQVVLGHEEERRKQNEAEAAERAEAARIVAEQKAEADKAAAIEAERQRVAREAAAQKAADERRAADVAHRARINNEVLDGLMDAIGACHSGNAAEANKICRAIIVAVAKSQIRHTRIEY